jgi:hypothetical protein
MSGKAQGRVYEMDVTGNEQAVLGALADGAEHDGSGIHVVIDVVAYKTGLNWRTCTRIIGKFVKAGWLVSDGTFTLNSGQKIPVYHFNYDAVQWKPPYKQWVKENGRKAKRDDKLTPLSEPESTVFEAERDVNLTPLSVQQTAKRGVKNDTKGVSTEAEKGCHSSDTLYVQYTSIDTAKRDSATELELESTNARGDFSSWLESAEADTLRRTFREEGMADAAKERVILWRVFECQVPADVVLSRMTILRSQYDASPKLTYWPGWWIAAMQRDAGESAEMQYRAEHNLPIPAQMAVTMPP